jgi:hypothetical protein
MGPNGLQQEAPSNAKALIASQIVVPRLESGIRTLRTLVPRAG